jgi:hypothetical protein
MPLALTARFKVCGPPDQPGRLNLDLARSKPLLVQLSVGTLCGLGVGFGGALIGGLRYAVAHGVDQGILYGEHVGLTFSLSVGLGIGLVGGLVHWLTQPSTRRTAADPRSTLGAARTVALCYLLVPSATCAITLQLLAWVRIAPAPSTATPILTGAGLGFCLGLVFAAAFTAWPTYVLARLTAFFSGAPYGLMRLCAAAHTCEILRQDGAAYQFRHAELREALSRWTPRRIEAAITSAE